MLVVLLILCGCFVCVCVKVHQMSFMKKLVAKIVMVYVMLAWLAICVWMVVFSELELYERQYDNTKEERIWQLQSRLGRDNMEEVMASMYYDRSYEAEFEYAWERGAMYRAYIRYELFSEAAETDSSYESAAESYRQKLEQICADSEFPENELYVEYYRQKLE